MDRLELAKEIRNFLSEHGKRDVNEPENWSSPDAMMLENAAIQLEQNLPIDYPFSEWGSGGYKSYSDSTARLKHDSLVEAVKQFILK